MSIIYLNGTYSPIEEAKISVLDRGFLFGDGVYEVIPVYNKQLFYYSRHMDRLTRGLGALHFSNTATIQSALQGIIETVIDKNSPAKINGIYIQITRGAGTDRNHVIPKAHQPTLFVCTMSFPQHTLAFKTQGIHAITCDDLRWRRCDIKSITLLPNLLARTEAHLKNAEEAILIKEGYALEGSTSNLFAVIDGTVITAPADHEILGGITRDLTIELVKTLHLPFVERKIRHDELFSAQEVWITSATREIMPVTQIDSKPIADQRAGPFWYTINEAFQKIKP